jgi:hypothetical protein
MKPAHKIAALHESPGVDLAEAMEAHLLLGYVTSTPDALAMARHTSHTADAARCLAEGMAQGLHIPHADIPNHLATPLQVRKLL